MSIWNDKELTAKIISEIPPQPAMKTYEVQWVRVEHQVYTIEVQAEDEEDAAKKAKELARSEPFDSDDYEVVYADEFVNDVEEVK